MFNALIRTHHITSRKKVTKLKQAADATQVYALLRSGSSPGIMYVEGAESGVRQWVDSVHVCIIRQINTLTRRLTMLDRTYAIRTTS
jgi:hypothetical protein